MTEKNNPTPEGDHLDQQKPESKETGSTGVEEATILSRQEIDQQRKGNNSRKIVYSLIGLWVVLLLAGFAYQQLAVKDEPQTTTEDVIAQQEQVAKQSNIQERQSQAKIATRNKIAVIGKKAPGFDLPGKDGRVVLSSYRGKKAVLVEFAASWCTHCRAEAPIIQQVLPKYPGVQMITVSAAREPDKVFEKWFNTFLGKPMIGELAFDNTLAAAKEYGVQGYPTMAFIDKQGKLIDLTSGELSVEELSSKLDKLQG